MTKKDPPGRLLPSEIQTAAIAGVSGLIQLRRKKAQEPTERFGLRLIRPKIARLQERI